MVEDDTAIANAVAARLRNDGFEVEVAVDGPSAVEACGEHDPDLVVLDVLLPGFDGFEVCRLIQRERYVPVLMLTALDDETDKLVGLRLGADDYMTKPFSPRELVARVHAILRRVDAAGGTDRPTVEIGGMVIDGRTRQVHHDGDEVHLTATEFDLLACLAATGGEVLTRQRLLAEVWGYRDGSGARTIDSHVRSIRRKLGDGTIRTVHGVGYAIGTAE